MGRARTSRRPLYFLTTILFSALLAVPVHGAEKTTLTVYFQWGNVIDTLNRAVEIFEAENPDIDVITVPACIDCGSGYEQLLVAIAGGAPPDLVTLSGTYYLEMVEAGLIEPLTEYLNKSEIDWQSKYHPALWESRIVRGEVYGIPAFEGGPNPGLIYNKDILSEAGVAEPSPDEAMTWAEFAEMARKLVDYDVDGRLRRVGFYPRETGANSLGRMALAYGVEWYDEEANVARLDHPRLVEAMRMLKTYFYDPWGYEEVENAVRGKGLWTNHDNSLFATGTSATLITGYWSPGELRKTMPGGNIGVTWQPNDDGLKVMSVGAWSLSILAHSRNKEAAWRLLEFLASPRATAVAFEEQGWLGGLHRDLPDYVDLTTLPATLWFVQALDSADVVRSEKPNLFDNHAGRLWNEVYDQVVSGKGDPEPLLSEANRVLNEIIAEELARRAE